LAVAEPAGLGLLPHSGAVDGNSHLVWVGMCKFVLT
jgi:hypothetical protein